MNILDSIPFLHSGDDTEGAELTEAEAKAERIKFHRRLVRNGPANFKVQTSGQVKRASKRALARDTKKARRRQVRQHLRDQREGASIRGNLQAAGVLPFFTEDYRATPDQALRAITWIVQRYTPASYLDENGGIEVTHEVVVAALTAALNRWQKIVGFPQASLSPAYRLPVALPDGSLVDEA